MDKPYYELDLKTKGIILDLKNKCKELNLGNISFSYYEYQQVEFFITKHKKDWKLTVTQEIKDKSIYWKLRDIYRIEDELHYENSEKDIL